MLKNLPKTSHQISTCEANYLRLKKLLNNFSENKYFFKTVNNDASTNSIVFSVLQKTKHTLIVEAKQKNYLSRFNCFSIRIHICIDAKLAEVVSYQGEKAIPSFLEISQIQSKDERMQQNRFLTEWLENIFQKGISSDFNFER